MARQNDTVPFAVIVLGAIASAVMALLQWANDHLSLVLALAGFAVFVVFGVPTLVRMIEGGASRALGDLHGSAMLPVVSDEEPVTRFVEPEPHGGPDEMEDDPYGILRAVREGRYDEARFWLQKMAYGMVGPGVSQAEKDRFRRLMTAFAAEDPLMQEAMPILLELIRMQPGLKQSTIYANAPQWDTETIRYVLYFAEQLGALRRIKRGSSYLLYAPDDQRTWVALTAQFRCSPCGASAGRSPRGVELAGPPNCSRCGAPMERVVCRHTFVAPRAGRQANDPDAKWCIDCGSYVVPEGSPEAVSGQQ